MPLGESGMCGLAWDLSEFLAHCQTSTSLADRHRKTSGMMGAKENLLYTRRLEVCGLFNLAKQRQRGDMNVLYKCIRGVNTREGEEQFKLKDNTGTRGDGYKRPMNKSRLQIRFLSRRPVRL